MTTRMPKQSAEIATVLSSEVPMLQTASTAGLTESPLARASDHHVAGERPQDEDEHARDDEAEADRAQRRAAARAGEVDGEPVEHEGQQREDDRQAPDQAG